jgi:hypothetical protein
LCIVAASFLSQPEATFAQSGTTGLMTKDLNQGETIANVLKILLGNKAGVTVSNVVYKGGDHAIEDGVGRAQVLQLGVHLVELPAEVPDLGEPSVQRRDLGLQGEPFFGVVQLGVTEAGT